VKNFSLNQDRINELLTHFKMDLESAFILEKFFGEINQHLTILQTESKAKDIKINRYRTLLPQIEMSMLRSKHANSRHSKQESIFNRANSLEASQDLISIESNNQIKIEEISRDRKRNDSQ
jgi:hypothetical protein